ncbi:MAG: hypothetical protein BGO40_06840 [Chryseobacterium sp. 39-10]|nr:hypothetical protein [Chryseobacterium sp.]OJV48000.1 MAG: hypothetical protein BGO40_06840 [Chryseobacterium sp. 39-10]
MREFFAVVVLFLSISMFSQTKNVFSAENEHEMNATSSHDQYNDPKSNGIKQDTGFVGEASSTASGCTVDGEPDCNCNGIPDSEDDDECPPNPADPIPINQHLPFLLLAATGIMVYVTYRRKSALK